MLLRSLKLSIFIVFFSSIAVAECPIEAKLGSSINNLKFKFNISFDVIPGEWGLEEVALEKKDICPNDKFTNLFATYSFLSNSLVEIKITSMENKEFNLIDWAKNNYGDPTEQTYEGNFVPKNNFMWDLENKIVFAEYQMSSNEVFQIIKIVSTKHESLFDEFYTNMAKGIDPTYKDRVNKFRREISNKYD